MKQNQTIVQMIRSSPQEDAQTALAMILTCLSRPASVWELEPMESAAEFVRAARAHGLHAEGRRMTAQELYAAPLPLAAHWRFCSFVVVSRVQWGRVWVHDPENGLRILTQREFEAGYTGAAVCFAGQRSEPSARVMPSAGEFCARFPRVSALTGVVQAVWCACCAAEVCALRLLAEGGGAGSAALFAASALLALCASALLWALTRRCTQTMRIHAARACEEQMRKKSPLFFRRVPPWQTAYLCESCGWTGAAQTELWLNTLRLANAAVCFVLLAAQGLWTALAASVPAALWWFWLREQEDVLCGAYKREARDRYVLRHDTARRMGGRAQAGGENRRSFARWLSWAGGACVSPESQLWGSWKFFCLAALAAVFAAGLLCMAQGGLSFGAFAGCLGAAAFLTGALRAAPVRVSARAALRAVRETEQELFCADAPAPQKAQEAVNSGVLSVQNISAVPKKKGGAGFRGVSFSVRRGEVLSVTADEERLTLSYIAAGLVPPAQGAACLGDVSLSELPEHILYQNIVLLGRGIPLPWGTVRQNIAAGGDISDYVAARAAADAQLHERLLAREQGYDTPAAALSDGERVLLEFACAFARETPFLVADACIQNLDGETQRQLFAAARRRGVGVIAVADGGEPARAADAVCRIQGGRVVLSERTEIVNWEEQAIE